VIAYGSGGVLDTVVPGETGAFFGEQSAAALEGALSAFDPRDFDPQLIRRHAELFDRAIFAARLKAHVDERQAVHERAQALEHAPLPPERGFTVRPAFG
jgi:hypothetical protein